MANKNIKGITIEIGGDTTTLDKALKGINSVSRDLQKELKQVEAALKLDPNNTELLAQKQKLLAESVSNTKEKLETLKEAEKQLAEQAKNGGEVSEQAQRELQREIINTQKTLEGLEEQAKLGHASLESFAAGAKKIGEKSEELGKKMLPVSAAIAGVGVAGVAALMELDDGYDTIITKTGASGEALDGLNRVMENVFGSMPIDIGNVGIAVGEVNTRFGETGDRLEEISKDFIRFSEINNTDLNNSIGTAHKLMEQFNVTSDNTAGVLGLITAKGQETGISVDNLMSSAQKNGAVFKEMGFGLSETIVFLSELEKNGVNADTAVAGLRKSVANYTEEGLSTEDALRRTIDSIRDAGSETSALSQAMEIFGSKGAAEMSKAIREGRIDIDNLSVGLKDYETVVIDTFEATLDPWDDAKIAMNNLKLAGADLGNSILTALQPAITMVVEKIKEFTEWFKNLNDGQKQTIITIGAVVAAIGPALITFGKLSQGVGAVVDMITKIGPAVEIVTGLIGSLKPVLGTVGNALSAFGATLMANPIFLIAAAVAAVIAALVLLYKNCEEFRDAVNSVWNAIKTAFFAAWDAIKTFFTVTLPSIFNTVIDFIKENWQGLLLLIINPFAGALKLLYDLNPKFKKWVDGLVEFFKELPGKIADKFNEIIQGIKDWVDNAVKTVKEFVPKIADKIIEFFKELPDKALEWGRGMIDGFIQGIKDKIKAVGDAVKSVVNSVADFIGFHSPSKKGEGRHIVEWGSNMIAGFTEGVKKAIPTLENTLNSAIKDFGGDINYGLNFASNCSKLNNNNAFTMPVLPSAQTSSPIYHVSVNVKADDMDSAAKVVRVFEGFTHSKIVFEGV